MRLKQCVTAELQAVSCIFKYTWPVSTSPPPFSFLVMPFPLFCPVSSVDLLLPLPLNFFSRLSLYYIFPNFQRDEYSTKAFDFRSVTIFNTDQKESRFFTCSGKNETKPRLLSPGQNPGLTLRRGRLAFTSMPFSSTHLFLFYPHSSSSFIHSYFYLYFYQSLTSLRPFLLLLCTVHRRRGRGR